MDFISYSEDYKEQVFPALVPEKYYKKYTNSSLFYKVLFILGIFRNYLFLLRDANDKVLGSIALRRKPAVRQLRIEWFIYGVAINEEYRGKGYGSLLLSEALAWCKEKGIKQIYLHVEADNETAINLYLKKGFNIVEPSSSNMRDSHVVMSKFLK